MKPLSNILSKNVYNTYYKGLIPIFKFVELSNTYGRVIRAFTDLGIGHYYPNKFLKQSAKI
jgi:hypothetical protein